ncbi:putative MATE family efflux protein [Spirosoma lacussanchae]|uniref:MATE family efflux transporter n=1 Tax=Spirosoma lacussanchae TaxID=1884249 RepID=UPI001107CA51|nr:MATE family efflux transporter [Spirosoma lacussanchae]
MSTTNPLGRAPIKALFFQYYGPALISMLSSTAHQVINGIIIGQQVGKEGLAAVGLYGPVIIVLVSLTLPIMIGGGVLIGKSLGAANYQKAQQVFQFATTLVLLLGGMLALTAPLVAKPLAQFLAGSGNTALARNTANYAFWQLISLPFFFLGMIWGNFVRADNAPKVSRNASILAAGVNVVLDLILIVGFHKGVEGASMATAMAFVCGPIYLFVYMLKGTTHYSIPSFRFSLRLDEWRDYIKIGLPSFASEIAFSSGLLLINQKLIKYGSTAIAAFGLINYLSFILVRLFTAAMIAALPIMSFNIGARQPHRVLETLRFSLLYTLALGVLIAALGFLVPDQLVTLFSGDQSAQYHQVASQAMSLYFLLFLAAGPNYLLAAYLQSTGKPTLSILINCLKGFVLVVLCLGVLPDRLGLSGVWLSRSLAEILTLLLVSLYTLYYRSKYYAESTLLPAA